MTPLEDLLSRALLAPGRTVPRDTVPPSEADPGARPAVTPGEKPNASAAADLRALCETLVTHTPATAVAAFVTDQVPEPRSALVLACVLQLTDTDDGARFWWQYAAGAGQPAAAYCLYLHHLALGETHTARWWHQQTDDVKPQHAPVHTTIHRDGKPLVLRPDEASTTTMLRVLRRLARHTTRPRSAVVTELMDYMPTAVAVGYLREPESELPLPGPHFACKIRTLLEAAADRPSASSGLPARPHTRPGLRRDTSRTTPRIHRQVDEAATHR
ncbi:hypothetical protein [Streptomyces sp. DH12]|uniref:hypothetical protein n=1 Tax=Streptomyces sp. DH12 TaxID=2857010 RepID=UPI001E2B7E97|nr:hypothetical protein [Streptomyces sp. DH12]